MNYIKLFFIVLLICLGNITFAVDVPRVEIAGKSQFKGLKLHAYSPHISVPFELGNPDIHRNAVDILSLHRIGSGGPSLHAVDSHYRYKNNRLYLIPAVHLSKNQDYEIRYIILGKSGTSTYTTPDQLTTNAPPTRVIQWYPTGPEIPENTLIIYAEFNNRIFLNQHSMESIQITETVDGPVSDAWTSYLMPRIPELKTLFPLMIHPGRIKTNVTLKTMFGSVLNNGKEYTLRIPKDGLEDEFYRNLEQDFTRKYNIGPPDTDLPEFLESQSKTPTGNTFEPLLLVFSEAMDYFSILSGVLIYLEGSESPVKLEISNNGNDSQWLFRPERPWYRRKYSVEMTKFVKDLAHNSLTVPFETQTVEERNQDHSIFWRFTPK